MFSKRSVRAVLVAMFAVALLMANGVQMARGAGPGLTEPFDDATQFTTSTSFFSDEDLSSGFDYFGLAGGV